MDDEAEPSRDRLGLEILTPEECWDYLAQAQVGRIAFMTAGAPDILPVTHAVSGGRIVFRSTPGTKLGAATMAPAVAFEVDGWDPVQRTGWSVLAHGTAETSPSDAADLDALPLDTWLPAAEAGTWIAIRVDELTGRRLAPPS